MSQQSAASPNGVTESRFYMWRALFAVAHADNFLALEEQGMLADYLDKIPFSDEQASVLREDMATPQNIEQMFLRITDDGGVFCAVAAACLD